MQTLRSLFTQFFFFSSRRFPDPRHQNICVSPPSLRPRIFHSWKSQFRERLRFKKKNPKNSTSHIQIKRIDYFVQDIWWYRPHRVPTLQTSCPSGKRERERGGRCRVAIVSRLNITRKRRSDIKCRCDHATCPKDRLLERIVTFSTGNDLNQQQLPYLELERRWRKDRREREIGFSILLLEVKHDYRNEKNSRGSLIFPFPTRRIDKNDKLHLELQEAPLERFAKAKRHHVKGGGASTFLQITMDEHIADSNDQTYARCWTFALCPRHARCLNALV